MTDAIKDPCPNVYLDAPKTFKPRSYTIQWVAADESYPTRYNLTPVINLFEARSEGESKETDARAHLIFWPDGKRICAHYDVDTNIYSFDFPIELASTMLGIVQGPTPFHVVFKTETGDDGKHRQWGTLRTERAECPANNPL